MLSLVSLLSFMLTDVLATVILGLMGRRLDSRWSCLGILKRKGRLGALGIINS
jgi:hypothetical protein